MSFNPCFKSIFVPLIVVNNNQPDSQTKSPPSTSTEKSIKDTDSQPLAPKKGTSITSNSTTSPQARDSAFNQKNATQLNQPQLKQCTCSKTKCLKKYCECYSNGLFCNGCNCKDCFNTPIYQLKTQSDALNQEMTCTCAKSNCNKKYCECYKTGNKCNDKCRCVNCFNKKSLNAMAIERTSIFIHNQQSIITTDIISADKVLGLKRNRDNETEVMTWPKGKVE